MTVKPEKRKAKMIFMYFGQFIVNPFVVLFLSAIVPAVYIIVANKKVSSKKMTVTALSLLLAMIVVTSSVCIAIAENPIVVIPEKYKAYFDKDRIQDVRDNAKSLYRGVRILFPGIIYVRYADEKAYKIHIQYFFYGTVDFYVDGNGVKGMEGNGLYLN